jgi:D-sedoheptulose 7-phosphate isomerase
MINDIKSQILETADLLQKISDDLAFNIKKIIETILECYENDGCVYFFGNGGSAADSQHLATEFVGRFKIDRKPLKALALTTDTSFLTAFSNDFDFKDIFSRQVEAFVKKNDVVIGISTSGNSINVLNGLKKAKEMKAQTIGFLGKDGGEIKNIVDISLIIPTNNTPKIQECHITIGHIICDIVEKSIFSNFSNFPNFPNFPNKKV